MKLAQYAVSLGASAIQLDYIRYKHTVAYKKSNSENIYRIVKYFRDQIPKKVALQMDIFGVAAHRPSITIGQDVKMLANEVNAINPMVYPSHYEPFRYYATRPYKTVL